jgi:hypothetical protein
MTGQKEWEYPSLDWIHRIQEAHYRKTKALPLDAWLKPVAPKKAAQACRRLGLKVRLASTAKRQTRKLAAG